MLQQCSPPLYEMLCLNSCLLTVPTSLLWLVISPITVNNIRAAMVDQITCAKLAVRYKLCKFHSDVMWCHKVTEWGVSGAVFLTLNIFPCKRTCITHWKKRKGKIQIKLTSAGCMHVVCSIHYTHVDLKNTHAHIGYSVERYQSVRPAT